MRTATSAALCDAVEIGVLQLRKGMSLEDICVQAGHGFERDEAKRLAEDALAVAVLRSERSPGRYPFQANLNYLAPRQNDGFDPYLFLLLGFALKRSCVPDAPALLRRFQRYFEDLVCWSLRKVGLTACVFSEPREERGLPKQLRPALAVVAQLVGEPTVVREDRIKDSDNDLDVDVVAAMPVIDRARSGRPAFLVQCTTSPAERLSAKMAEGYKLFCSVWRDGFYPASSVRVGATPEDLLTLDPVDWGRLSQQGWVLDRMRLTELVGLGQEREIEAPAALLALWDDLSAALPDYDWRNGWQQAIRDERR